KYDSAQGTINLSTPKLVPDGDQKILKQINFTEALGINSGNNFFYIVRDIITNREYLFKGTDLVTQGLKLRLNGFNYKVLYGFEEAEDKTGDYKKLYNRLKGKSIISIKRAVAELNMEPVHKSFELIFKDEVLNETIKTLITKIDEKTKIEDGVELIVKRHHNFLNQVISHFNLNSNTKQKLDSFINSLSDIRELNISLQRNFKIGDEGENKELWKSVVTSRLANYKENILILLLWVSIINLKDLFDEDTYLEVLLLGNPLKNILKRLGRGEEGVAKEITLLNILLEFEDKLFNGSPNSGNILKLESKKKIKEYLAVDKKELIEKLLEDNYVQTFIGANYYEDEWYYSKERFEELVDWLMSLALIKLIGIEKSSRAKTKTEKNEKKKIINRLFKLNEYLKICSKKSEYKLEALKKLLLNPIKE
ncbi:MAG: hypothetical protein KAQ90_03250, partial [Melioribacteraceae bacterium]|nr:hypothetical protein [Melioribacteraceae bacterium]